MEDKVQNREQPQVELQGKKGRARFLSYLNLKDVFDPSLLIAFRLLRW